MHSQDFWGAANCAVQLGCYLQSLTETASSIAVITQSIATKQPSFAQASLSATGELDVTSPSPHAHELGLRAHAATPPSVEQQRIGNGIGTRRAATSQHPMEDAQRTEYVHIRAEEPHPRKMRKVRYL